MAEPNYVSRTGWRDRSTEARTPLREQHQPGRWRCGTESPASRPADPGPGQLARRGLQPRRRLSTAASGWLARARAGQPDALPSRQARIASGARHKLPRAIHRHKHRFISFNLRLSGRLQGIGGAQPMPHPWAWHYHHLQVSHGHPASSEGVKWAELENLIAGVGRTEARQQATAEPTGSVTVRRD